MHVFRLKGELYDVVSSQVPTGERRIGGNCIWLRSSSSNVTISEGYGICTYKVSRELVCLEIIHTIYDSTSQLPKY